MGILPRHTVSMPPKTIRDFRYKDFSKKDLKILTRSELIDLRTLVNMDLAKGGDPEKSRWRVEKLAVIDAFLEKLLPTDQHVATQAQRLSKKEHPDIRWEKRRFTIFVGLIKREFGEDCYQSFKREATTILRSEFPEKYDREVISLQPDRA